MFSWFFIRLTNVSNWLRVSAEKTPVVRVADFAESDVIYEILYWLADYMWAHELGGPPLSALVPGFPTQAHPVGVGGIRRKEKVSAGI